jgi:hypothetical protein
MDLVQQKRNRHFLRKEEAGSPLIIIFSFCQERILFWSKTDINIFDFLLADVLNALLTLRWVPNKVFSVENVFQIVYLAAVRIFSCKFYT